MSGQRWAEFAAKAAFVVALGSLGVFVAVRAAVARDGRVGSARSFVTVAGTLTGPGITPGTRPVVTFEFLRAEDGGVPSVTTCRSSVAVAVGEGGAFSEPVPLDVGAPPCPDGLFDGRDVWVRALVGGTEVAAATPINPVPYAHFATSAGTTTRAALADQLTNTRYVYASFRTDEAIPIGGSANPSTSSGIASIVHTGVGLWRVTFTAPFAVRSRPAYAVSAMSNCEECNILLQSNTATSVSLNFLLPVIVDGGVLYRQGRPGELEVTFLAIGEPAP